MKTTAAERQFFQKLGKRGGKARAKKLTPERRREIAQIARQAQLARLLKPA